jgi:hypothetical protein
MTDHYDDELNGSETAVDFLKIAVQVHKMGLSVLPCAEGQKHPNWDVLPRTDVDKPSWSRYKYARATLQEIQQWARRAPHANPAIICGTSSQIGDHFLGVIDIEHPDLFVEMRQYLEARYGRTWVVRSFRGGHIYFLSQQPVETHSHIYNGMKFEVRGQGSYVLAWGARHPKGIIYTPVDMPDHPAVIESIAPFAELQYAKPDHPGKGREYSARQLDATQSTINSQSVAQGFDEVITDAKALSRAYKIASRIFESDQPRRRRSASGDTSAARYRSASEFDMSVITACCNAGIPASVIRHTLSTISLAAHQAESAPKLGLNTSHTNPSKDLGAPQLPYLTHYQKLLTFKGRAAADQNFTFSYQKASSLADTPRARKAMADLKLVQTWLHRQYGSTKRRIVPPFTFTRLDLKVLQAHIHRAMQAKSVTYQLDCRTGAEMADCSSRSFTRSTAVWRETGLLHLVEAHQSKSGLANVYQVDIRAIQHPHRSQRLSRNHNAKFTERDGQNVPLPHVSEGGGGGVSLMSPRADSSPDANQTASGTAGSRGHVAQGTTHQESTGPEADVEPETSPFWIEFHGSVSAVDAEANAALEQFANENTYGVFGRGGANRSGESIYRWLLVQKAWVDSEAKEPDGENVTGQLQESVAIRKGKTVSEMRANLQMDDKTLRRNLSRMKVLGIVIEHERCYSAVRGIDFLSLAKTHGILERLQDRASRHKAERQRHQSWREYKSRR